MCNKLHDIDTSNFREIPQQGVGWKVFRKCDTGQLLSWNDGEPYVHRNGTVRIEIYDPGRYPRYIDQIDGFCFFTTKDMEELTIGEKDSFLRPYSPGEYIFVKILYYGGLGSRRSPAAPGYTPQTSLCKSFRLHPSETKKGLYL